ncbi:hypothetical protein B4064_3527 [Caldibacillus thermoamylovorans]|nr:hypothetical protein [Caldibacillus thermoamylovorans]KIO60477.1 hypothetical protein B4064_3527 [Caldibacillus thermoamylovorans]
MFEKDADEFEEALSNGIIDKPLYDLAWNEVKTIRSLVSIGDLT